ncbi:AP2/ERF domain-containing protein [Pycnococcus provasolii]
MELAQDANEVNCEGIERPHLHVRESDSERTDAPANLSPSDSQAVAEEHDNGGGEVHPLLETEHHRQLEQHGEGEWPRTEWHAPFVPESLDSPGPQAAAAALMECIVCFNYHEASTHLAGASAWECTHTNVCQSCEVQVTGRKMPCPLCRAPVRGSHTQPQEEEEEEEEDEEEEEEEEARYRGVSYAKELQNKYRAFVHCNRKKIHLGAYETAMEAAFVRDRVWRDLAKDPAMLNFKETVPVPAQFSASVHAMRNIRIELGARGAEASCKAGVGPEEFTAPVPTQFAPSEQADNSRQHTSGAGKELMKRATKYLSELTTEEREREIELSQRLVGQRVEIRGALSSSNAWDRGTITNWGGPRGKDSFWHTVKFDAEQVVMLRLCVLHEKERRDDAYWWRLAHDQPGAGGASHGAEMPGSYTVKTIHQRRAAHIDGITSLEYLVEWVDYPNRRDFTWEPRRNIEGSEAHGAMLTIDRQQDKKAPSSRAARACGRNDAARYSKKDVPPAVVSPPTAAVLSAKQPALVVDHAAASPANQADVRIKPRMPTDIEANSPVLFFGFIIEVLVDRFFVMPPHAKWDPGKDTFDFVDAAMAINEKSKQSQRDYTAMAVTLIKCAIQNNDIAIDALAQRLISIVKGLSKNILHARRAGGESQNNADADEMNS